MHFFIFWGFVILGLQITTMFGRAYSDHFYLPGLSPHLLGGPYMLLRDLMEVTVLVSIGVAFVRWLGTRPPRLFGFSPAENRLRARSVRSHGRAASSNIPIAPSQEGVHPFPEPISQPLGRFRNTRAGGLTDTGLQRESSNRV